MNFDLSAADILARNAPRPPVKSGVYFLILENEIVYVGQAVDILRRIAEHAKKIVEFDSWAFVSCDVDAMDALEFHYQQKLAPRFNSRKLTVCRSVSTPSGDFPSIVAAATAHGIDYNKVGKLLRTPGSGWTRLARPVVFTFIPPQTTRKRVAIQR